MDGTFKYKLGQLVKSRSWQCPLQILEATALWKPVNENFPAGPNRLVVWYKCLLTEKHAFGLRKVTLMERELEEIESEHSEAVTSTQSLA